MVSVPSPARLARPKLRERGVLETARAEASPRGPLLTFEEARLAEAWVPSAAISVPKRHTNEDEGDSSSGKVHVGQDDGFMVISQEADNTGNPWTGTYQVPPGEAPSGKPVRV